MQALPSGTVTFLFTDIEGSTRLIEQHPDAMEAAQAGHGGQTLLSSAAAEELRPSLPSGTTLRDLGAHKLRGLADAENIYQLVASDLPSDFPPLRVEDAGAASGAPLRQLVRGQLVGRGGERRELRAHWDQAQQARGH